MHGRELRGHELPLGRIALAGAAIALAVTLAVVIVLVWLNLRGLPPGGAPLPPDTAPPGPLLQSAPQPALRRELAPAQQRLDGLGWIDAAHGIAHIPIDDAMVLLAQRAASAPEGTR